MSSYTDQIKHNNAFVPDNSGAHILNRKYIGKYTALFAVCAVLCYIHFIINHKSLVFYDLGGGGDGLVIHYNSFVYYGHYLRSIIKDTISNGRLTIPMWDMSIGYGQDIIQTLWFYAVGDPFAFLSVFIPTKYSELGYCAVTILELYCAGLSFSYFSLSLKNDDNATIIGALVYTMSSYPLYIVTMHPYFSLPMISLPLLLVGANELTEKRFSAFYVIIIALSSLADFYFFYMLCIFVFLYAILQYITVVNNKSVKSFVAYGTKFILNSLLGVGISAVLCLPVIYGLLGSSRVQADNTIPLLYPIYYYQRLFVQLIGGGATYYSFLGYTALGLICAIVLLYLFFVKKKYVKEAISLLVLVLFVCIPFAAHVFNGFSYVTNRWIWGLGFVFSYVIVKAVPEINQLRRQSWLRIASFTILYIVITLLMQVNRNRLGIMMMATVFVAVICLSLARKLLAGNYWSFSFFVLGLTLLLLATNAYINTSPNESGYVKYFGQQGKALNNLINDAPGNVLNSISDESVYRFDTAGMSQDAVKRNSNMILRKNGTSHYYSTNSGNLSAFVRDVDLNNSMEQTYTDLDSRTYLDGILGVKYIVVKNGSENKLPYGYSELVRKNGKYSLYKADSYLPLAFLTDRLISKTEYDKAGPVEKQQILTQAVVLSKTGRYKGREVSLKLSNKSVEYTIVDSNNIKVNRNSIVATQPNATMVVKFNSVSNGELYWKVDGLDYKDTFLDRDNKGRRIKRDKCTLTKILFESGGINEKLYYLGTENSYYSGVHDFIANLGYSDEDRSAVKIVFCNSGEYSFDNMELCFQPMDYYEESIRTLSSEEKIPDLKIGTNRIDIDADASKDEYLFLSVLDSSGWSAFVDNKKEDIITADSSFMAVAVPKGKHHITLYYETPMLKTGLMVSIISFIILIILILIGKRTEDRRNRCETDSSSTGI